MHLSICSILQLCFFYLFFFFVAFPLQADQNDPELNQLFEELQTLPNEQTTRTIEQEIWTIWITSNEPRVNQMMQQGIKSMRNQDYQEALRIFNEMVKVAPRFAEGWNKRATLHYLLQNYEASLADIERTLALEPRHFGAISGLGLVHVAQKNYYDALQAYQDALKIHPTLISAKINIIRIKNYLKKQIL